MNFVDMTAFEIAESVKSKKVTALEVAEYFYNRAKDKDQKFNSFISFNDKIFEQAKKLDQRIEAGESLGPLCGVPVAVKDLICTKDLKTTAASKMLSNFVPPYSAHLVKKLISCDALILGKTNLDEFAMGSSNETSFFGPCKNPWNEEYVPGGSSGGSAAAVAARLAPLSIGTDTGGSIRQPAHFCGIVGLKPTYGRISRYGIIAFASSLDQAGPMATNIKDTALLLEAISGFDAKDSTTHNKQVPKWLENINAEKVKGLKIGLPKEFFEISLSPDTQKIIETVKAKLVSLGAELVDIALPHIDVSVPVYYLVATSEASSNLARYDGVRYGYRSDFLKEPAESLYDFYCRNRSEGFGKEVKRRIMLGTYALSSGYYDAYYNKACQVRRLIQNGFNTAFDSCDVILGPVSAAPAFKINEKINNTVEMYFNDTFTTGANLAGLPAISIPCDLSSEGLPIGLQFIAPQWDEQVLFDVGLALENGNNFSERLPHV